MTTYDQSNLNLPECVRLAKQLDFPDFVKKADLTEITGQGVSKYNLFAYPKQPSQFPCHTKAATFISHLYFFKNQDTMPADVQKVVERNLEKFASLWGIKNTINRLKLKYSDHVKAANDENVTYALAYRSDDGEVIENKYPLRSAEEVKAACEWFNNYLTDIRKMYSFSDRRTIASNILDKAAELQVRLEHEELLEKCAARGLCNPQELVTHIRNRVKAAQRCDKAITESLEKLAHLIEKNPKLLLDTETKVKFAETIDQFDRLYNLIGSYSSVIPSPEDMFNSATFNKLSSLSKTACQLVTGSVYDSSEFNKVSKADLRQLYGDEVTDHACDGLFVNPEKLAEVAETFPRPDAELFEKMLNSYDIKPLVKSASGMSLFDFAELLD